MDLGIAGGLNLIAADLLAVAIMVVLRLRRLALVLIAIMLVCWIVLGFGAGDGFYPGQPFEVLFLTCYLLEGAALIASPGPRRALELLTWKAGVTLAAVGAVLTLSWTLTMKLMFGTCPERGPA